MPPKPMHTTPPTQQDLDQLFADKPNLTIQIRYYDGYRPTHPLPGEVFEITDSEKVNQLISILKIEGHSPGLRSIPRIYLDFFANGEKIEELAYSFREHLRWAKWRGVGMIEEPIRLIQWFREIGFSEPWERELAYRKKMEEERKEMEE